MNPLGLGIIITHFYFTHFCSYTLFIFKNQKIEWVFSNILNNICFSESIESYLLMLLSWKQSTFVQLVLRHIQWEGIQAQYHKCHQLPNVWGGYRQQMIGNFLSQFNSYLYSKYLSLQPQINVSLTPYQIIFF